MPAEKYRKETSARTKAEQHAITRLVLRRIAVHPAGKGKVIVNICLKYLAECPFRFELFQCAEAAVVSSIYAELAPVV